MLSGIWVLQIQLTTHVLRAGPAKRVWSVFNRGCTAQFIIVFHKKLTTCSTDIYDHDSYFFFVLFFFFRPSYVPVCLMKDFRYLDYPRNNEKKEKKKEKEPRALSSYVSCGPLVKISSKTHVICAVYAHTAVRTSFAQICPRSRPIFPVFVEDIIPTTSNQKTLESNRGLPSETRHNHEINAFREQSRRVMCVRTSSYVVRSKTCAGMLRVHSCRGKTQSLRSTKDAPEAINFSPREFVSTGTTSRCSYVRIL